MAPKTAYLQRSYSSSSREGPRRGLKLPAGGHVNKKCRFFYNFFKIKKQVLLHFQLSFIHLTIRVSLATCVKLFLVIFGRARRAPPLQLKAAALRRIAAIWPAQGGTSYSFWLMIMSSIYKHSNHRTLLPFVSAPQLARQVKYQITLPKITKNSQTFWSSRKFYSGVILKSEIFIVMTYYSFRHHI